MFTGIVEEVGKVRLHEELEGHHRFEIMAQTVLEGLRLGDSIAINGACLTVVALSLDSFSVEAVPETLRRTNLGLLKPHDGVNLERALPADGRFGGHIVQGHVEGVGTVVGREDDGSAVRLTVAAPTGLSPAIVPQGFIAVDGVSLTVVDCSSEEFTLSIIPFTQSVTTFGSLQIGDTVNIETDILARYVERLMAARNTWVHSG